MFGHMSNTFGKLLWSFAERSISRLPLRRSFLRWGRQDGLDRGGTAGLRHLAGRLIAEIDQFESPLERQFWAFGSLGGFAGHFFGDHAKRRSRDAAGFRSQNESCRPATKQNPKCPTLLGWIFCPACSRFPPLFLKNSEAARCSRTATIAGLSGCRRHKRK